MIDVEKSGDMTVITPESDVIADKVPTLRNEVLNEIKKTKKLVIDMAHVSMIDSSGIGILISAQNTLKPEGGALEVINVSEDIIRMFKIMRLDKHFSVTGR